MLYEFKCKLCDTIHEEEFDLGTAPKKISCNCEDGAIAKRHFGSCNFELKGGGWAGKKISLDNQMTEMNRKAGERMWKEWGKGSKVTGELVNQKQLNNREI